MRLKSGKLVQPEAMAVDEIGDVAFWNGLLLPFKEPILYGVKAFVGEIGPGRKTGGFFYGHIPHCKEIEFDVELSRCIEMEPILRFDRLEMEGQKAVELMC